MEIFYANTRIQKNCDSISEMRRAYGDRRARVLDTRLNQLKRAVCLDELRHVAGRWHELTGNRKGQIAADLGQPYRLIIVPFMDPPPTKEDGGLDWSQIKAITIVDVIDYH